MTVKKSQSHEKRLSSHGKNRLASRSPGLKKNRWQDTEHKVE
jgi:hypothetical protein